VWVRAARHPWLPVKRKGWQSSAVRRSSCSLRLRLRAAHRARAAAGARGGGYGPETAAARQHRELLRGAAPAEPPAPPQAAPQAALQAAPAHGAAQVPPGSTRASSSHPACQLPAASCAVCTASSVRVAGCHCGALGFMQKREASSTVVLLPRVRSRLIVLTQHAEGSSWVALDARPAQLQTDRVVACQGRRRRRLWRAARQLGPAPSRTGRLPRPRRCVLVRPATAPARRRCTPCGARPTSRRPRRRSGPRSRTRRSSGRPFRRMLASAPRAPCMHRPRACALHHSSQPGARQAARHAPGPGRARLTETGSVQANCWGTGVPLAKLAKQALLTTCFIS
jgi:hypothetical protein